MGFVGGFLLGLGVGAIATFVACATAIGAAQKQAGRDEMQLPENWGAEAWPGDRYMRYLRALRAAAGNGKAADKLKIAK